jgi:hypothetical protein
MLIAGITWQLVNLRIANILEMMYAAYDWNSTVL